MFRTIVFFLFLAALAQMLVALVLPAAHQTSLRPVATHYVKSGPHETGAANIVTSVVVTYRGLDTLGEVTILFLATTIIGFLLRSNCAGVRREKQNPASELLNTAAQLLSPLIFLFGTYIFVNGHLTPGGGFQGGAILASGAVLLLLANPVRPLASGLIHKVESLAGVFYVLIGISGLFFASGFLDNRILPLGKLGSLFSAGAIPVIYSLIGLKVGAELTTIIDHFREGREDAC